jgi:hypothetical protein
MESIQKRLLIEILSDQNLKKEFINNPKKVLRDKGYEIDENADFRVLEDTKNLKHLVIPFVSEADFENGEELERRFSKRVL